MMTTAPLSKLKELCRDPQRKGQPPNIIETLLQQSHRWKSLVVHGGLTEQERNKLFARSFPQLEDVSILGFPEGSMVRDWLPFLESSTVPLLRLTLSRRSDRGGNRFKSCVTLSTLQELTISKCSAEFVVSVLNALCCPNLTTVTLHEIHMYGFMPAEAWDIVAFSRLPALRLLRVQESYLGAVGTALERTMLQNQKREPPFTVEVDASTRLGAALNTAEVRQEHIDMLEASSLVTWL